MHAAKLSYALMTLLPLLACQLGLSLLSRKPGSSHVDNWSPAQAFAAPSRCLLCGASAQAFKACGIKVCAQCQMCLSLLISASTVAPTGTYLLDDEHPDNE